MPAITADDQGHVHAYTLITSRPSAVGSREAYDIGDGLATVYNVGHGLASADVLVQVYRKSDGLDALLLGLVSAIARTSSSNVRVTFLVPPASAAMRVVIMGTI